MMRRSEAQLRRQATAQRSASKSSSLSDFERAEALFFGDGSGEAAFREALRIYRRLADAAPPHANAVARVGDCLYEGKGVAADAAQAAQHWRRAAELGSAYGCYALAACHENADVPGVPHSEPDAFRWYLRGAELGEVEAMYEAGRCYSDGFGVRGPSLSTVRRAHRTPPAQTKQNLAEAQRWLEAAAASDCVPAYNALGALHNKLREYKRAFEWLRLGAKRQHRRAQSELGDMVYLGRGTKQSLRGAFDLYAASAGHDAEREAAVRRAADADSEEDDPDPAGDAYGAYAVGTCYRDGEGVARDAVRARRWFAIGAQRGSAQAQEALAEMYRRGLGGRADAARAAKLYRAAAEAGNACAQFYLGEMLMAGEAGAADPDEGLRLMEACAATGDAHAVREVIECHLRRRAEGRAGAHEAALKWAGELRGEARAKAIARINAPESNKRKRAPE